jgi:hypothetical protein
MKIKVGGTETSNSSYLNALQSWRLYTIILPIEDPTNHLLYGSRKETSKAFTGVLRLTKFWIYMVRGYQFST